MSTSPASGRTSVTTLLRPRRGRVHIDHRLDLSRRNLRTNVVVNAAITQSLKYLTHRERPDGSDNFSFPSGRRRGGHERTHGQRFRAGFLQAWRGPRVDDRPGRRLGHRPPCVRQGSVLRLRRPALRRRRWTIWLRQGCGIASESRGIDRNCAGDEPGLRDIRRAIVGGHDLGGGHLRARDSLTVDSLCTRCRRADRRHQ